MSEIVIAIVNCGDCKFFVPVIDFASRGNGTCHLNPPEPKSAGYYFRPTRSDEFCGQGQSKLPPKTPAPIPLPKSTTPRR